MVSKYRFIYTRLATVLPTAFISLTIIFFLLEIVPGDTADVLLGPGANQQDIEFLRKMLGLDLPPHERYLDFLVNVVKGDFGISLATSRSVNKLIMEALPVTLTLAVSSMLIALLIGIPSGIISAIKRNTRTDLFVSFGALVGISVPGFWLGMLMLLFFAVYLKVLPGAGFVNPFLDPIEGIKHLIMPSLMLGLILAGFISRITRSSLIEVMLQDYILTARAKGLPERIIIYKHALKNALIPVVTVVGFQFGALLGGAVIAETIFTMSGIGKLIYSGIIDRDFPVVEGVAITMVLTFILINLVVDLVYMYLDPRVRLG
ncbi:MAG: ABC transporter permease [Nitrososphaerales archaeon]